MAASDLAPCAICGGSLLIMQAAGKIPFAIGEHLGHGDCPFHQNPIVRRATSGMALSERQLQLWWNGIQSRTLALIEAPRSKACLVPCPECQALPTIAQVEDSAFEVTLAHSKNGDCVYRDVSVSARSGTKETAFRVAQVAWRRAVKGGR
jgi:hypothetical protein